MTEATRAFGTAPSPFAGSDWFDPLEETVRSQVRSFIEQLLEEELEVALGRGCSQRGAGPTGRRHGHRPRQLVTTFGPLSLSVRRARLHDEAGEQEWKSALLPAYQQLSRRRAGVSPRPKTIPTEPCRPETFVFCSSSPVSVAASLHSGDPIDGRAALRSDPIGADLAGSLDNEAKLLLERA
jgi:hypothetical protein